MSADTLHRLALAAARLWAAQELPYFAAASFALEPVAAPGVRTMGVDDTWHLYVDPAVVDEWTVYQCGAVLIHEVNHLLRDHASRSVAAGVGDADALRWNLACDAEVNDDLVELDLPLPGTPIVPKDLGCPDGRLAEEYYQARQRWSVRVDCGSGAHGQPRDWERGTSPGLSRHEANLVRRQVAEDVRRARQQGAHIPDSLGRWADETLEPTVDWQRELGAQLRRSVGWAAGRVDYTFTRRSRRASIMPRVILPGLAQPVPEVAVICDTSGSMHNADLAVALAEIRGLLTAVGVRDRGVTVLSVDTAVRARQRVRSPSRVELRGGGGTNLIAGLDACAARRPRPGVVIVLTDGYTDWPAVPPPDMAIIVGLVGTDPPPIPPYARAVRIGGAA